MQLKKSIFIFFVALITVGSIGVPVFTHTCKTENTEFKTLFVPSSHCEEEVKEKSCQSACCEVKDIAEQEDCCSDDVQELKFSFDIFQKISQEFYLFEEPDFYFSQKSTHLIVNNEEIEFYTDSSPPPLETLHYLQRICTWRI